MIEISYKDSKDFPILFEDLNVGQLFRLKALSDVLIKVNKVATEVSKPRSIYDHVTLECKNAYNLSCLNFTRINDSCEVIPLKGKLEVEEK